MPTLSYCLGLATTKAYYTIFSTRFYQVEGCTQPTVHLRDFKWHIKLLVALFSLTWIDNYQITYDETDNLFDTPHGSPLTWGKHSLTYVLILFLYVQIINKLGELGEIFVCFQVDCKDDKNFFSKETFCQKRNLKVKKYCKYWQMITMFDICNLLAKSTYKAKGAIILFRF